MWAAGEAQHQTNVQNKQVHLIKELNVPPTKFALDDYDDRFAGAATVGPTRGRGYVFRGKCGGGGG